MCRYCIRVWRIFLPKVINIMMGICWKLLGPWWKLRTNVWKIIIMIKPGKYLHLRESNKFINLTYHVCALYGRS